MSSINATASATSAFALLIGLLLPQLACAQVWDWKSLPDARGEFVRLRAPHMVGRSKHPEAVCLCLHDDALATVTDSDMREALMRGISETGVPTIENAWIPREKRQMVNTTFNAIARPVVQCMLAPR